MNTLVQSKYLTALLTITLLTLAAFQAAVVGGLTVVEGLQLLALFIGAVVTYFAPLTTGSWPALFKVLGAVIGAALVAIISVINGAVEGVPVWNAETIALVAFAAVSALATQFGVDQRVDAVKAAIAAPEVTEHEIQVVDPKAAAVARTA